MSLDQARVTVKQVTECLHVLAAANHRQWALWEGSVIPHIEASDTQALTKLRAGKIDASLQQLLQINAEVARSIVKERIGGFAYEPPLQNILERKLNQLTGWVTYAATKTAQDIERWKLQCRTPFIQLTAASQRSDYVEAVADLQLIAQIGGLVLPSPLPSVEPLAGAVSKRRQLAHSAGIHGMYEVSEEPWSLTCQACARTRSI